ncbi:Putative beta-barrel porin 2 [Marinobacter sp. es.042]|nr:Putative beta-barrel porin 2 [Marinobacter sp. es.042]
MASFCLPGKRLSLLIVGFLCFDLLANSASAAPLTLSGGLINKLSDNTAQSSSNEITDIETRANLRVSHLSDPGRCSSETLADLGYGIWHEKTFDPETYTSLDFQGGCDLGRGFSWELSDNLRDVALDSGGTDTPDNTTRKNVFRTGPSYTLSFTQIDQLQLSAKYENTEFSEPEEADSERYVASAAWNHLFSQSLSAGISLSTNQAEFDTGAEIDTDVASVIFSKTWSTTRIAGSLGVSQIESDFGGSSQSSDGWVGNIELERDINPVTLFYLNASREFTDQTSDFDIRFGEFVFDLRELSEVEVTAIDTGVRRRFKDASQLEISVFANRADYIRANETEDGLGLSIGYRRPVIPLLTFNSTLRYQYETFDVDNVDQETASLDAALTYELTRDLGITGRIGHTTRTSDAPTSEYEENWILIGLDYRFF